MADRGQAFTLEAITAALLLLAGLVFALQATAVTPLSASTSSQHIENQQESVGEGILTTTLDDGSLKRAVLFWDSGAGSYHSAAESYYVDKTPDNKFGDALERAFTSRSIVTNVYVHYRADGREKVQRMVYRGEPSDNAVSASVTLTLSDDDVLYDANGEPTTTQIASSNFFAPDAHPGSGVYNVVEVEVVAWRQ